MLNYYFLPIRPCEVVLDYLFFNFYFGSLSIIQGKFANFVFLVVIQPNALTSSDAPNN